MNSKLEFLDETLDLESLIIQVAEEVEENHDFASEINRKKE